MILNQSKKENVSTKKAIEGRVSAFTVLNETVWPFLFVAVTLGITNASLIITVSFYFEDVIVRSSENALTYASIGFMLSAIGSLIGQLIFADKLNISPSIILPFSSLGFQTLV